MPFITVDEQFDSRTHSTGDQRSETRRYVVEGTSDSVAARLETEAQSPKSVDLQDGLGFLVRRSVTPTPLGEMSWRVVVQYRDVGGVTPPPQEAGGAVLTFDTGGGIKHITQSIATVNGSARPGPAPTVPDFHRAIGVTDDEIQGVDIIVPVYNFTEAYTFDSALITFAFRRSLFLLTGRVNNTVYGDFQPGELLFKGASGSRVGNGDWNITYSFSGSPNVTDITIGDIGTDESQGSPPIVKAGWDYLWVRYQDDVDDTGFATMIKRPVNVFVEQVYRTGDFSVLKPS